MAYFDSLKKPIRSYLVDVETQERIEFQFNPDNISDNYAPIYQDHNVPGLSHPRPQYISGEANDISFSVYFFYSERDKTDVKKKILFLRSFCHPDYEVPQRLKRAPHKCLFVFGDYYNMVCEVRKANIITQNLYDPNTLLPLQAQVDMTLRRYVKDSIDYKIVRNVPVIQTTELSKKSSPVGTIVEKTFEDLIKEPIYTTKIKNIIGDKLW